MHGPTASQPGAYLLGASSPDSLLEGSALGAWIAALAVAGATSTAWYWSQMHAPLPMATWAAAFLFLAVAADMRTRRIPNFLTAPAMLLALMGAVWTGGPPDFPSALTGAGTACVLLFPLFALGALGAGDVKALMVLGAFWGPLELVFALPWMFLAGGVLAVLIAARHGLLADMCARWFASLAATLTSRRLVYLAPPVAQQIQGVPFAVAIVLGAIAWQNGGPLWD